MDRLPELLELGDNPFGDYLGVLDEIVDGVEHDHVQPFFGQVARAYRRSRPRNLSMRPSSRVRRCGSGPGTIAESFLSADSPVIVDGQVDPLRRWGRWQRSRPCSSEGGAQLGENLPECSDI